MGKWLGLAIVAFVDAALCYLIVDAYRAHATYYLWQHLSAGNPWLLYWVVDGLLMRALAVGLLLARQHQGATFWLAFVPVLGAAPLAAHVAVSFQHDERF